jgi:hypothetical protein
MRSVARRRPGAFLLGAVAAGVVAGRFGRNLREEMSDDSGNGSSGNGAYALPQGRTFAGDDQTVEVVGGPARTTGQRPATTPPTPTSTPTTRTTPTTPPPPVASPAEPGGTGTGSHGDPLRDDPANRRTDGGNIGHVDRADADDRGAR